MERSSMAALCEAALPAGRTVPATSEATVHRAEEIVEGLPPAIRSAYRALLVGLDARAVLGRGRRFASLPIAGRLRLLERLGDAEPGRLLLRGLLTPLKLAHFELPETYAAFGLRHRCPVPPNREAARWHAQISDAGALGGEVDLECEVVIVGTGAGGAPVAAELASQGVAVLMLEEGGFFDRTDFDGRPLEMMRKLYRKSGLTASFGNTIIPIPVGKGVGGTTLVNSGTCFRTPDLVLRGWAAQGLTELAPRALAPYFARVEEELGVAPSSSAAIGAAGRIIARGCDRLGWSHHPLARNAPGCDGQGLCCFGCPTEAKRSTNVSFVPRALARGAQLMTGVRVERVLLEGDRATGVIGRARTSGGGSVRVTVRAPIVVLACGSLHTPALLLRQGICNESGELGRNLSIHPAGAATALFAEEVNSWHAVPQGYAIDQFADEGLYFEGASLPLELQAASLPGFGPAFTAVMDEYNRSLSFGFMVKDRSRGRVRPGPDLEPRIAYWLGSDDLHRIQRGFALLARVFFAAGAWSVHAPIAGWERFGSVREIEAFEQARLAARDIDLSAYHPLGTARMGVDPLRSVVAPNHETHDVLNLFISDGSVVPESPGVNPQITIMAFALRAAEAIARRLQA